MRLFGFIACWLVASAALAQEDPGSEEAKTAQARAQFREGVEHAQRGEWQEAADRFGRALDLRETPQIRYNLAESLYHLGRLVEASEHVVMIGRDEEATDDVKASAEVLLARIESETGRLTVHVDGQRPGVRIMLDGRELPPALIDIESPVDPGRHVARAVEEEAELESAEVLVPKGGSAEVHLTVPPLEETELEKGVAASLTEEKGGGSGRVVLWVVLGAALVSALAAGLAIGLGGEADPTEGDFDPGVVVLR